MEKVIDRAAYRRKNTTVKEIPKENIEYFEKKTRKILYQLFFCSIVLLCLSIAKLYKNEQILEWVSVNLNENMSFVEIYEFAYDTFIEIAEYLNSIEEFELTNIPLNNINLDEDSAEASTDIEDNNAKQLLIENKFEEAVEGVNQLSEDSEYIKGKYKLVHPLTGTVTSVFGVRESNNKIVTPYHSGIDVAANKGTNIYAAISGEVITATTDNAYGKYIMIETDEIVTVYAHCSEIKVKKGQKVTQGELIGKVGSTGWATGPHLHFEIRLDGRLVNPADVLDYSNMGA